MSVIGVSPVFPCSDIEHTAEYYERVPGFKAVKYLNVSEPLCAVNRRALISSMSK